jgi:putative ABC transport system permease protein
MIFTDLKIAIRNIKHNKVTSTISIVGLGIGLASIILLFALIIYEKSFDKFIPDYQNVYRATLDQRSYTPFPLAENMKKEFPAVKDFFRINQFSDFEMRNAKDELVKERFFAFADPSIFKILGIKMLSGTSASSISEVAISEKMSKKYFGTASPLGAVIKIKFVSEFTLLTVTGVYKDFPANSTLYPEFIADIKLTSKMFAEQMIHQWGEYGRSITDFFSWNVVSYYTYLSLEQNADKKVLISQMQKYGDLIKHDETKKMQFNLQPVRDIYLNYGGVISGYEFARIGNNTQLKYYWAISLLILLISVTNYIFLTRASTSDRLREIGARKVLGASNHEIRRQIILESTLITLLSLIPAFFVIDPGISFINSTLNRNLTNEVFSSPVMWLVLILVVLFIGIISGLSIGHKVARIPSTILLKGKPNEKTRSGIWDYSFLVFHFSLYIILVVIVLIITRQINYSLSNNKGLNPKNVLIIQLNSTALKSSLPSFCAEMEKFPGVEKVAGASDIPPMDYFNPLTLAVNDGTRAPMTYDGLMIGEGLIELLDMELIEGSSFSTWGSLPQLIFNESAARQNNIKVGDLIVGLPVKGIVRDFSAHSFHSQIKPMVLIQQNPLKMRQLAIKTNGKNDAAIIKKLGELYNQIDPNEIFEVRKLTDLITDFYSDDKNEAKLIEGFSVLAAVLAIMGLFGIALISIARKTKQIGLRKVNGATVIEILYLVNKGFIKWVFAAILIGVPASYFIVLSWQTKFAYKTAIVGWVFILAGLSAILIALLTVSGQSWKAATRNPVEALRYE